VSAASVVDIFPSQMRLAVMRLARRLRQESGADITLSQFSALATVDRLGPLSLKELADVERVTPPSMTRISTCLEERGLVVRTVDAADRRVARLATTDAGRQLLEKTRSRRDAYLALRMQSLSAEERATLERALPILERLIGEQEDQEGGR
jgi:DNA-binding MarR family transcriptional regulator